MHIIRDTVAMKPQCCSLLNNCQINLFLNAKMGDMLCAYAQKTFNSRGAFSLDDIQKCTQIDECLILKFSRISETDYEKQVLLVRIGRASENFNSRASRKNCGPRSRKSENKHKTGSWGNWRKQVICFVEFFCEERLYPYHLSERVLATSLEFSRFCRISIN